MVVVPYKGKNSIDKKGTTLNFPMILFSVEQPTLMVMMIHH